MRRNPPGGGANLGVGLDRGRCGENGDSHGQNNSRDDLHVDGVGLLSATGWGKRAIESGKKVERM